MAKIIEYSTKKRLSVGMAVLAAVILLLGGAAFAADETADFKTMTYKTVGERQLEIHVHYPPGWKRGNKRAAIVFFFGGGWNNGTVDQFLPQAEYFASRGMVTARADYRVKSRDGVTPDKCVEDARSAVRWMRQNSKRLGIDPDKLVTSGGSAGGHLAACMMIPKSVEAYSDDLSISTIPAAMVLFNPVLSFQNEQIIDRLGGAKSLAPKLSPTLHLNKNTPPAIILFGTEDRLKVFGDEYWGKAETLGVRAEKYLAQGQGHGFFNRSPWLQRTTIAADRFLESVGLLSGPPTMGQPSEKAPPKEKTQPNRQKKQDSQKTAPKQRRTDARKQNPHPDTSGWPSLFDADLSNAEKPKGVWTVSDGVLTASEDQAIWTTDDYENFVLDLEFKTAEGTNSGVIVYCTSTSRWIPNSVEIQIADDHADKWAKSPPTWQCGAIFGRLAPSKSMVKEPGQWNRFTITCQGRNIDVALNGETVTSMNMKLWKSATTNPDGSSIPPWLSNPLSKHPTKGRIGLQGKHAGAPIWFRNIKIKKLE